jgi:hypothetical protein
MAVSDGDAVSVVAGAGIGDAGELGEATRETVRQAAGGERPGTPRRAPLPQPTPWIRMTAETTQPVLPTRRAS